MQTRRNWAIISHPDAGKTTLTEKLLLYGGAIQEAGDVKARRSARHATSDVRPARHSRIVAPLLLAYLLGVAGVPSAWRSACTSKALLLCLLLGRAILDAGNIMLLCCVAYYATSNVRPVPYIMHWCCRLGTCWLF